MIARSTSLQVDNSGQPGHGRGARQVQGLGCSGTQPKGGIGAKEPTKIFSRQPPSTTSRVESGSVVYGVEYQSLSGRHSKTTKTGRAIRYEVSLFFASSAAFLGELLSIHHYAPGMRWSPLGAGSSPNAKILLMYLPGAVVFCRMPVRLQRVWPIPQNA